MSLITHCHMVMSHGRGHEQVVVQILRHSHHWFHYCCSVSGILSVARRVPGVSRGWTASTGRRQCLGLCRQHCWVWSPDSLTTPTRQFSIKTQPTTIQYVAPILSLNQTKKMFISRSGWSESRLNCKITDFSSIFWGGRCKMQMAAEATLHYWD